LGGSKDQFKLIEVIFLLELSKFFLFLSSVINSIQTLLLFKDFINTECLDKVKLEEALKNYSTRNSEIASKTN